MSNKLVLIDGNSIATAAYFALPKLATVEGIPTGAVYGFVHSVLKLMDGFPSHFGVVFDTPVSNRKSSSDTYKCNRKPMDQELRSQYSLIKEYLRLMNIPYYSEEGYEADDLLASFVAKFHAQIPTYVATRDKDLFQVCMYPNAFVILVSKATNRVISAENVKQIMGITPQQIATFKALSGDTSDNIKGVRGIGPKTAVELINTFGTLPFIVDAALSGKIKKNTAALIVNNLEEMLDSHFLGSLQIRETDVPLEDFQRHPGDENKLNAFYKRLDLRSLLLK